MWIEEEMKDTCRPYTDLAWLWPMWGDATTEYAHYCLHVTSLIRQYANCPATTLLDIGCGGGKNVLMACERLEQAVYGTWPELDP